MFLYFPQYVIEIDIFFHYFLCFQIFHIRSLEFRHFTCSSLSMSCILCLQKWLKHLLIFFNGSTIQALYLHHILPLSSLFPLLLLRLEMLAPRLWLVDVFEKKCALVKLRSREGKIKNQFYLNVKGTRVSKNAFLPNFTC